MAAKSVPAPALMRRCILPIDRARYLARFFAAADKTQGTKGKFHGSLQIGVGRGGGAG